MPELPEVETLRRSLEPILPRRIVRVFCSSLAPIETTTAAALRQALQQATVHRLSRWGKYLLLHSEGRPALVLHLGMSGKFIFYEKPPPRPKHTHLELECEDGSLLRFIDPRRFGTLSLCEAGGQNAFLARLGPDYLDPKLTPELFIARCLRHPQLNLKTLLLNQAVAAGLGNIYVCEALYQARLHPLRLVRDTTKRDLSRLLDACRERLELGILHGGTTFRDYLNGLGHRGAMQDLLEVYDREGQRTRDGRGRVERIVQQGRSTFFCPERQR